MPEDDHETLNSKAASRREALTALVGAAAAIIATPLEADPKNALNAQAQKTKDRLISAGAGLTGMLEQIRYKIMKGGQVTAADKISLYRWGKEYGAADREFAKEFGHRNFFTATQKLLEVDTAISMIKASDAKPNEQFEQALDGLRRAFLIDPQFNEEMFRGYYCGLNPHLCANGR